jgi:anti-anti-sigma regulatory factor
MMAQKPSFSAGSRIEFACPDVDHVVVRIVGRGSFENSASLRRIPDLVDRQNGGGSRQRRYIFDLADCTTMDSTFFGVLASLALGQRKAGLGDMILLKVNSHLDRLLQTLGLSRFMDVHTAEAAIARAAAATASLNEQTAAAVDGERAGDFEAVATEDLGKADRIVLMLEAHQRLSDISKDNALRFRNVIDCLEAALEEEQGKPAAD